MIKKSLLIASLLLTGTSAVANDTARKVYAGIAEDGNTLEIGKQFQKDLRGYGYLNYFKENAGNKEKWTAIGVGIDKIKSTGDKTIIYYGIHAGKLTSKDDSGSLFGIRSGFEYFLDNSVTLGAKVSLYKRSIGDELQGLDTSIRLKYYF